MMAVPAMAEAQGMIKRRVKADTTCFAFAPPPQTTTTTTTRNPSGGGGEPGGLALRLTCHVTMYISANRHGLKVTRSYRRSTEASCRVVPGSGEDGVRDALRGLLRSIRALQELGLTDGEWESIVPEDVVPELADPQAQARHGAAEVNMAVDLYVRYDVPRVLMTACKEVDDDDDVDAEAECSVCFDALLRGEEAVELPGCAHAFHRRCISTWFRRKPTCPLCRGDVVKHLDPELQNLITVFTDTM